MFAGGALEAVAVATAELSGVQAGRLSQLGSVEPAARLASIGHSAPMTIAAELPSASQLPQLKDSERTSSGASGRSTIRNSTQSIATIPTRAI